jgi:hypothetical protein
LSPHIETDLIYYLADNNGVIGWDVHNVITPLS